MVPLRVLYLLHVRDLILIYAVHLIENQIGFEQDKLVLLVRDFKVKIKDLIQMLKETV